MGKVTKLITMLMFCYAFFIGGCTATKEAVSPAEATELKSVAEQVIAAKFPIIKIDEVRKAVGDGMFNADRAVIIDARPERLFDQARIPSALNIPDNKFEQFYPALVAKSVRLDANIIIYCGGVDCVKSLYVGHVLREKGFKNIKVYLDGMPDWVKQGEYVEIGFGTAKKLQAEGVKFIDARPERVFAKGTIPGSVNVPDNKFEQFKNLLPVDKNEQFVVFCGGYDCVKSHAVAEMAKAIGYTKIAVYAGGMPEWEKLGGPMGDASAPKAVADAATSGIKRGSEEGTVDTEAFKAIVESKPANVTIVDVRGPAEFQRSHLPGSINIDVNKIYKEGCEAVESLLPASGDIIFYCSTGGRSGEMYFGLVEDCGFKEKERLYFLDSTVKFEGPRATVE